MMNVMSNSASTKQRQESQCSDAGSYHHQQNDTGSRKRKHHEDSSDTHQQWQPHRHHHRRSLTPVPSPSLCNDDLIRHTHPTTTSDSHLDQYTKQQQTRYVLVTGGAGYIGSHTVLELLNANYSIVVMDNLVNSNLEALARVEHLSGKSVHFVEGDVTCEKDLDRVFQAFSFWAVVHFAAIKAVGESTQIPLDYYHNNVTGSLHLFRVMDRYKVKNLVFSSSATVYGEPDMMPVNETASLGPVTNPYGRTKLFVEVMLQDVCASDPDWNVCLLRFFNPVGAHPSGLMGECPQGIPNNLLPYVIQVLQGHLPCVQIFGSDYDTVDGTGVRDYIHVCDLATGHVAALKKLEMEELKTPPPPPSSSSVSSACTAPASTTPVVATTSPSSIQSSSSPLLLSSSSKPISTSLLSSSALLSPLSTKSSSPTSSPWPSPSPTPSPSSPSPSSSPLPSSSSSSSSKTRRHRGQCIAYNLGTGAGYSVLEIIYAMEKATQKTIPYKIVERRPGDVGVCTADATLANQDLGWKPLYTMDDMCQDMWRWTKRNPNGYDGPLIDCD